MKNIVRRSVALLLSVVMLLSFVVISTADTSGSEIPEGMTLGRYLASEFGEDLTDGEKALLNSDILLQPDMNPDFSSSITVEYDEDKATVVAANYTDENLKDFIWKPVALTVYNTDGTVQKTVENSTAEVDLPFGKVEAKYALTISAAQQDVYLKALKNLQTMVNTVKGEKDALSKLIELLDGTITINKSGYSLDNETNDIRCIDALRAFSIGKIQYRNIGIRKYACDEELGWLSEINERRFRIYIYTTNNDIAKDYHSRIYTDGLMSDDSMWGQSLSDLLDSYQDIRNYQLDLEQYFPENGYKKVAALAWMTDRKPSEKRLCEALAAIDATIFLEDKEISADNARVECLPGLADAALNGAWENLPPLACGEDSDELDAIMTSALNKTVGAVNAAESLLFTKTVDKPSDQFIVTNWNGAEMNYCYGATLQLPAHEDPGMEYIYMVNGIEYSEGTELPVTDDLTITREAWEKHSWGSLLSTLYTDECAKSILSSAALNTGYVKLHFPNKSGVSAEWDSAKNTYAVKADPFAATDTLHWQAVSALAMKNGNEIESARFNSDGSETNAKTATISTGQYDGIEVTYQLDLPCDKVNANDILSLPNQLRKDADVQLGIFGELCTESIKKNLGKVQLVFSSLGEQLETEAGKASFEKIKKECMDEKEKFLLYRAVDDSLTKYTPEEKLAFYYENYTVLNNQMQLLSENLEAIVNDKGFKAFLLEDQNFAEYSDRITEMTSDFNGYATRLNNAHPSKYINTAADEATLLALAQSVLDYVPVAKEDVPKASNSLTLSERMAIENIKIVVSTKSGETGNPVAGGGAYEIGEVVTVTAEEDSNKAFLGWYDNNSGKYISHSSSYSFEAAADTNLEARYSFADKAVEFTVTQLGQNGTDVTCSKTVSCGDQYTASCTDSNFKYWADEFGNVLSTSKEYTFTVTSDRTIHPICEETSTVIFLSSYGQILSSCQIIKNDGTVLGLKVPEKPIKLGYTFTNWCLKGTSSIATDNEQLKKVVKDSTASVLEFIAQYTKNEDAASSVAVIASYQFGSTRLDNDSHQTIARGASITLKANKNLQGKTFSYWKLDDMILSYSTSVTIRPTKNVTVIAVYVEETSAERTPVSLVSITDPCATEVSEGKYCVSFSATRNIPEGYKVIKVGVHYLFIAGDVYDAEKDNEYIESLILNGDGVKEAAGKQTQNDSALAVNICTADPGKMFFVRAFVTYKDTSGNLKTIYSDVAMGSYNSISKTD